MELDLMIMALVGSIIGEGVRKDLEEEGLIVILDIIASGFLAFLFVSFLGSFEKIDRGILVFLAGFLGYLGELYTKELCLKALKRYTKKGD